MAGFEDLKGRVDGVQALDLLTCQFYSDLSAALCYAGEHVSALHEHIERGHTERTQRWDANHLILCTPT